MAYIRTYHEGTSQSGTYDQDGMTLNRSAKITLPLLPEIGQWYARQDMDTLFQVVAIDEDTGLIEIQDADGDVDELDTETWRALPISEAAPPEDWIEPVEDEGAEDSSYGPAHDGGPSVSLDSLSNPLDELLAAEDEDAALPGRWRTH